MMTIVFRIKCWDEKLLGKTLTGTEALGGQFLITHRGRAFIL